MSFGVWFRETVAPGTLVTLKNNAGSVALQLSTTASGFSVLLNGQTFTMNVALSKKLNFIFNSHWRMVLCSGNS